MIGAAISCVALFLVLWFFYFMAAWGAKVPDPFSNPDPMPRKRRGSGVNTHHHENALRAQQAREQGNLADGRRAELAAAAPEDRPALEAQHRADDRSNQAWYDQAMAAARNRDREDAGDGYI